MKQVNNLLVLGALLLLAAAAALTILNWPALNAVATWQLGFAEVQWPVGVVILLLAALLFAPLVLASEPRRRHDDRNPPHGGRRATPAEAGRPGRDLAHRGSARTHQQRVQPAAGPARHLGRRARLGQRRTARACRLGRRQRRRSVGRRPTRHGTESMVPVRLMKHGYTTQGQVMNDPAPGSPGLRLGDVDAATLAELLRRLRDIEHSYRAAAEKMGQLYMYADGNQVAALTRRLDQPMRNASQNERDFAALLDELQVLAKGPTRRP